MPDISPDVIAAAQAAERTYGIPASTQLAQFGQESGWGIQVQWQDQRVSAWEYVRHA